MCFARTNFFRAKRLSLVNPHMRQPINAAEAERLAH
jgi:hypothetical protein